LFRLVFVRPSPQNLMQNKQVLLQEMPLQRRTDTNPELALI